MSKVSPAPLDPGYSCRVDQIDKDHWHDRLPDFDDISFYQTWSYGEHSWGRRNISHLVLTKDDSVVAMAQLRIGRVPLVPAGIAYLTWGPLWRRKGQPVNFAHLRNVLRALQQEYVVRRRYLLRIFPKNVCGNEDEVKRVFCDEGFTWSPDPQQTVFVSLSGSTDEILKRTRRKWRQTLNKALKGHVEVVACRDGSLHDEAKEVVREMMARKHFVEFGSMENVLAVDQDLPDDLKLECRYCRHGGKVVAVLCWFSHGIRALPLVNATGAEALPLNAAYILWWGMVEHSRERGCLSVDLAGVNKDRNPGGYTFKTGLAGESGTEETYLGQFDACRNTLSAAIFGMAMRARQRYRDARRFLRGSPSRSKRRPEPSPEEC